jgi:hypothetical protein
MVRAAATSEDRAMFPDAFIPLGQVPATAARLERAAGELRERAGSPDAVPRLPVTLAHLEGAFDQVAATMRLLAEAAAEWCDPDEADEGALPPEAGALLWHLRSVANTLTDARDGCRIAGPWADQLLERAAPEPESGVIRRAAHTRPRDARQESDLGGQVPLRRGPRRVPAID